MQCNYPTHIHRCLDGHSSPNKKFSQSMFEFWGSGCHCCSSCKQLESAILLLFTHSRGDRCLCSVFAELRFYLHKKTKQHSTKSTQAIYSGSPIWQSRQGLPTVTLGSIVSIDSDGKGFPITNQETKDLWIDA
ncbi:hypothetical protein KSP39_PZI015756 [Platanthera zijinensis]|uniref:Uncharacterized protein n=1 Tax=Platanthera zijinensis TaxID=2320716 RepID=A0AAP0B9B8_9ASPA